jgi:hypothetical protein
MANYFVQGERVPVKMSEWGLSGCHVAYKIKVCPSPRSEAPSKPPQTTQRSAGARRTSQRHLLGDCVFIVHAFVAVVVSEDKRRQIIVSTVVPWIPSLTNNITLKTIHNGSKKEKRKHPKPRWRGDKKAEN